MIGVAADLIQHTPEGDLISIDWVYEYTPHDTYLFELLKPYGFTFAVVREIVKSLDTFSGKVFYSQTHRLLRDRENFIIQPLSDLSEKPTPSEDFLIHKHDINLQYPVCLCLNQTTDLKELPFGKQNIACLDFDKLHFPLHIRRWQQGDWFVPLGIKGRKKLSDFFVDQKLSLAEKEKIWLLLSGDEIVWVIGHRIDNRYRITSKTTKAMVISGIDETGESETMACGCSLLFS
jgi:tRNA(Ile)-lysidine synthase